MEDRVDFLENDFFSGMFKDINNLTDAEITAMKKKNGFNFKQLQAYKNRIKTETINKDWHKKQAEIEAAKRAAEIQAAQGRVDRSETNINKATEQGIAINKNEGIGSVNPAVDSSYSGGTTNPHTQTGWSGSEKSSSSKSSSSGNYGRDPGGHHWADGGRVGLRYGGLLSIL